MQEKLFRKSPQADNDIYKYINLQGRVTHAESWQHGARLEDSEVHCSPKRKTPSVS